MSSFATFERAAPELAARVRVHLAAHVHQTIATLRADGSPRISGTESKLADGELWIGSMWQARKALDLRRDPRFALHSGSDDPPAWCGDAKLAGLAVEVTDPAIVEGLRDEGVPPGPFHLFRLDLREVSHVRADEDGESLVIELWTAAGGTQVLRRRG